MATGSEEDQELNDLLDDAFEDLTSVQDPESAPCPASSSVDGSNDELWKQMLGAAEGPDIDQLTKQFGDESQFAETIRQLSQQDADAIPTEEELEKMFQSLAMGGGESRDANSFLPMMESMMQSLLSKDLLYPALQDLCDKFPNWLADNREALPAEEYQKYNRQFDLVQRMCREFESEAPTDTEAQKRSRFDNILEMMQQMQDLGHPPKELVGDVSPFGVGGANAPPLPDQCAIS